MWSHHVTGFKVESQTALQLLGMAVLVGCRSFWQSFRVQAAHRQSACRLAAAFFSRRYVLSNRVVLCPRLNGHGAVTRYYSSDSKDDLRVRYLDGEDSGKFLSQPALPGMRVCQEKAGVIVATEFQKSQSKGWHSHHCVTWCHPRP